MNYQQTIEYLFSQLPVYQRIGAAAYKADLNNTIALCDILINPQEGFSSIHIGGTNGKGSVSHMTASILQTQGLKVGLYTSPHLKDFRERIKINGKMIPKKYVIDFVKEYKERFEEIGLSFFEMTVGMAFKYFSDEKVDIAVIEVGLGGRLDSTNIIKPIISVITNISYDHTALLGDSLWKIATEKAGIIKENTPVIIGETQEEIKEVFINKSKEKNAKIWFADSQFKVQSSKFKVEKNKKQYIDIYKDGKIFLEGVSSPLIGNYQKKNIPTVLQTIEILNEIIANSQQSTVNSKNTYNKFTRITTSDIKRGIANVIKNTGLMGRWQILSREPLIVCDVGHNEAGISYIVEQIEQTPHERLHIVFGMVNDKDSDKIIKLMPKDAEYYFCKADIPRGLDVAILAEKAKAFGLRGEKYISVQEAINRAKAAAEKNDMIFIGGSTFIVAEGLEIIDN